MGKIEKLIFLLGSISLLSFLQVETHGFVKDSTNTEGSIVNVALKTSNTGFVEYGYQIPSEKYVYKNALLYFNDIQSVFIHSTNPKGDTEVLQKNGGVSIKFDYGDNKGQQVYRNHLSKKIKLRFAKNSLFEDFTVNDTWIPINWKIKNQFKKIGKYG